MLRVFHRSEGMYCWRIPTVKRREPVRLIHPPRWYCRHPYFAQISHEIHAVHAEPFISLRWAWLRGRFFVGSSSLTSP